MVKNPPVTAGDARGMGSIPGLGRSLGVENGNPLQYLEGLAAKPKRFSVQNDLKKIHTDLSFFYY